MSILGKKWVVENHLLSEIMEKNLDDETVVFHDPFLLRDMEVAVKELETAILEGKRILVFGDYDVDGISGTAILVQTLRKLGANVSYRLPDRNDGYGLNQKWIEEFKKLEIGMLITVDCGISNWVEIEEATRAGIKVIITDHHMIPSKLPESAVALVHPELPGQSYPYPALSGSAVAFKLAVGLVKHLRGEEAAVDWRQKTVDLASLGTVADCMPLTGENRWIVKQGIDQMRQTEWEGLSLLLEKVGISEVQGHDSDIIGFRIGPRINAAGRLETPYYALQLLLNENGSAAAMVQKLENLNEQRQSMVMKAIEEAEERIHSKKTLEQKILILWDSGWPAGIIGLIAARLCEKYNRPTIILEDRGEGLVASCRSPQYFNIAQALRKQEAYLKTYGGHAAAAGFSIEAIHLKEFVKNFEKQAAQEISEEALTPILSIDYEVKLEEITMELCKSFISRAPYGVGNCKPRFLVNGITAMDLKTVGREQGHLRFQVQAAQTRFTAIAFKFGEHYKELQEAVYQEKKDLDVVFELERNVWNGREDLQLRVVDLRISG